MSFTWFKEHVSDKRFMIHVKGEYKNTRGTIREGRITKFSSKSWLKPRCRAEPSLQFYLLAFGMTKGIAISQKSFDPGVAGRSPRMRQALGHLDALSITSRVDYSTWSLVLRSGARAC